jgi:hypothetical protein
MKLKYWLIVGVVAVIVASGYFFGWGDGLIYVLPGVIIFFVIVLYIERRVIKKRNESD